MATQAPYWLGPIAKKFFTRTLNANPQIKDRDGLSMMAEYYETWRTAQAEVAQHCETHKTFLLNGSIHPSMRVGKEAHQAYERIGRRLGLWNQPKEDPLLALELDLGDEDNDLEADENAAN